MKGIVLGMLLVSMFGVSDSSVLKGTQEFGNNTNTIVAPPKADMLIAMGIDPDDYEYYISAFVILPLFLVSIGSMSIPTMLIMLFLYSIRFLIPEVDNGDIGRSLKSSFPLLWTPVQVAQKILREEECFERISCEVGKLSNHGTGTTVPVQGFSRQWSALGEYFLSPSNTGWGERVSRLARIITGMNSNCSEFLCKSVFHLLPKSNSTAKT